MALLEENDILFASKALNLMPGLTDATKRVAAAIIDHFNKRTGQCDPSIERLATLLGIDRATVIRATEKLHELSLVEKVSHGGKAHRAAYLPNWGRFRSIVEDWDARMKTGEAPGVQPVDAAANVAPVRRSRSQACDVKGRSAATQTHRSNPSKKPIETAQAETRRQEPATLRPTPNSKGLLRGSKPEAQRSLLLPITGGASVSHGKAARAAAERRWYAQLHALGQSAEASVLDWITPERQEAATEAEMHRRGGGLAFIQKAMIGQLFVREQAGAAGAGACHGSFLGVG